MVLLWILDLFEEGLDLARGTIVLVETGGDGRSLEMFVRWQKADLVMDLMWMTLRVGMRSRRRTPTFLSGALRAITVSSVLLQLSLRKIE